MSPDPVGAQPALPGVHLKMLTHQDIVAVIAEALTEDVDPAGNAGPVVNADTQMDE
jgi:hypothetical protein